MLSKDTPRAYFYTKKKIVMTDKIQQELDKLISFSGTPTVVWRRTGEICLVAPEFCMLTEWTLEDLLGAGRKKYIYEVYIYISSLTIGIVY
jgi:hypothetical protein